MTAAENGNTRVRLRDYFELWMREHERVHEQEEKIRLASDLVMNERLGKLNELRSEVIEDRAQYARRDVVDELKQGLKELQGRFAGALVAFAAISALGAVATIIVLFQNR